jgi:DNA polymerase III epsilon subunit-like protein
MISDDTLKRTITHLINHGRPLTLSQFEMTEESLNRYVRLARERGITQDIDYDPTRKPNVLVLDIETTPIVGTFWRLGKNQINYQQILRDRHLLSYAVKWLFEDEIYSDILTPDEIKLADDRRITEQVWKFVDHADIIIAHNGIRFDMKMLNTRFLMHGMNPPSPYQSIDTLRAFWRIANFTSNKQGYLNEVLCLTGKMEHEGLGLWHRCLEGEQEALDEMQDYNEQDIVGLEELYITVRPWIPSHPNMGLYHGVSLTDLCHRCGSDDIDWLERKPYVTNMNRYSSYRCNKCGGIGISRTGELSADDKKHLTKSVAR